MSALCRMAKTRNGKKKKRNVCVHVISAKAIEIIKQIHSPHSVYLNTQNVILSVWSPPFKCLYRYGQMKCEHSSMNHNTQIARFLSTQAESTLGLNYSDTKLGNVTFPINQWRITIELSLTVFLNFGCSGSFLICACFAFQLSMTVPRLSSTHKSKPQSIHATSNAAATHQHAAQFFSSALSAPRPVYRNRFLGTQFLSPLPHFSVDPFRERASQERRRSRKQGLTWRKRPPHFQGSSTTILRPARDTPTVSFSARGFSRRQRVAVLWDKEGR